MLKAENREGTLTAKKEGLLIEWRFAKKEIRKYSDIDENLLEQADEGN